MIDTTSSRRIGPAAFRAGRRAAALAPLLLAAGCAAFPYMAATATRPDATTSADDEITVSRGQPTDQISGERRPTEILTLPGNAPSAQSTRQPATEAEIAALVSDEQVDATLAPQTIPQFTATVFGGVLGVPYTMTPDVAQRVETIAGGTGGTVSKRNLFRMTQLALKQYGIEVYVENGFVTVGDPGGAGTPGGSEIVRGRSIPTSSGRVVQVFNVQTIEVNALQALLSQTFNSTAQAQVTPDVASNSLIISGNGRDVAQLVRLLREIDQPRFAGANVLRVEPAFMSAEALAAAVDQALTAEGYIVGRQASAGVTRSIIILPFPAANQLLIFAKDPELADRANFWVANLDRPASMGDKTSTFVYQVRNTDAASLGRLAMGQAPQTMQAQPPTGVPGAPPAAALGGGGGQRSQGGGSTSETGQFLQGRLLTDPVGNRILFMGSASDYAQLRTLLATLDTPAPQVVMEIMIAEVTLTDKTALGVQLFGEHSGGDGDWTGNTGGIAIGSTGASFTFTGPDLRAAINANASNNRVNVLQRPQLVARSGEMVRFQVGTDVPIITSQRATNTNTGNNGSDVLQSVQYRQTGVITEVTPIVYGDRIDLTITQEISSAGEPPAGTSIGSPTILNRSLTTRIQVANGWTGVLGGLIANNYSKTNSGVPFLKDLPLVGSAFQANSVSGDRTELLILVTPHIVRSDQDMADRADRYAADMNAAFRTGAGWSYTLTPFGGGPAVRGIGLNLPSAARASERPPLIPPRTPRAAPQAAEPEAAPPEPPAQPDTPPETPPPPAVVMAPPNGRP